MHGQANMSNRRPSDTSHFKNQLPANGKEQAESWFRTLRDDICAEFEAIEEEYENTMDDGRGEGSSPSEPSASTASSHVRGGAEHGGIKKFNKTPWDRPEGGGGEISTMKGRVFEKVGVNISTVHSKFSEQFQKEIPGGAEYPYFWASGISLVAHMCSPLVPAVHMNTRMITLCSSPHSPTARAWDNASHADDSLGPLASPVSPDKGKKNESAGERGDNQTIQWFGGGADLTPMYPDDKDTADFHGAFKQACDAQSPDYYPKYKEWCDEYFHLKHRNEPRGVGGIFYDYLSEGPGLDGWQKNFGFTQDVGKAFLDIYPKLIRRHMNKEWTDEQRQWQLEKRGRYVEFNLLYDRGTRFGLMTGGNVDGILMSMPPEVKWP